MSDIVREPLVVRLAGALERAFNPIMVKELRASFRGGRFAVIHISILCLFGAGLLLALAAAYNFDGVRHGRIGDPSQVGSRVYTIIQLLQTAFVFLVVPGLAATSISSERESQTFDMLVTTTMSARQIIWGKFSAAMMQTFIVLVSMLPLLGICFLFGGVTIYQLLANYVFLLLLSALLISLSLSTSSGAKSAQRAVGTAYFLPALLGFAFMGFMGSLRRGGMLGDMAGAYGFTTEVDYFSGGGLPTPLFDLMLYVYAIPAFLWVSGFSLFFIQATHRLLPVFANRSTALRIHFTIFVLGAFTLGALVVGQELESGGSLEWRSEILTGLTISYLALAILAAFFASEEPLLPRHLQEAQDGRLAAKSLRWLFGPGAASGVVFATTLLGLLCGLTYFVYRPFTAGYALASWKGWPDSTPLSACLLVVLAWTWAITNFGRFMVTIFAGRQNPARVLTMLGALTLALGPLIHWSVWQAMDRDHTIYGGTRGPVSLLLSPVMAVLSLLDWTPPGVRRDFPSHAGGLPLAASFVAFAAVAGTVFWILGSRARRVLLRATETPPPEVR